MTGPERWPEPSPERRPFWEGLREGRLLLPRCRICGRWRWPPAGCREHPNLPYLANLEWSPASGRGRVFVHTVPQVTFSPSHPAPYVYALVELEEGPVMVSNVIDCPPEEVAIGMPVRLVPKAADGTTTLPLFVPDREREGAP